MVTPHIQDIRATIHYVIPDQSCVIPGELQGGESDHKSKLRKPDSVALVNCRLPAENVGSNSQQAGACPCLGNDRSGFRPSVCSPAVEPSLEAETLPGRWLTRLATQDTVLLRSWLVSEDCKMRPARPRQPLNLLRRCPCIQALSSSSR